MEKIELSKKEVQIVKLLCSEYEPEEIAFATRISVPKIKAHIFKIREKLNARTDAGIVVYALKRGIIKL